MQRNITFCRLTAVAPEEIVRQMNDPRVAEHMPLLRSKWDRKTVLDFVLAKEACWDRDGLGHWGIFCDEDYAGWGGFQKEGEDWDFGLVLRPEFFGSGLRIFSTALVEARKHVRLSAITFLLPPSRTKTGVLKRLGAMFAGSVVYGDESFLKYRLDLRESV
ncbi:hypothetical protein [Kiloniella sp. b19]|uniref:hypothetical protein n=1 Tax=Kiloniella sp. GXU_MW_B19 TaxID=3141326 RepID=UPI0031D851D0